MMIKKIKRELTKTYHFRNIPKTKFKPKSCKTKIINDDASLQNKMLLVSFEDGAVIIEKMR